MIISLETYRVTEEQGNNKLSYTVASCWSFYENCIMMHGTMNVKQCKMLYSMEEHVFVRTFYQTSCFFVVQNFDVGRSYLQLSFWYRSLNFCICQVSCEQCSIVLMSH